MSEISTRSVGQKLNLARLREHVMKAALVAIALAPCNLANASPT